MTTVTTALWKGCLGGIGLAMVFFAISGITYLILTHTGLSYRMILFVTFASGPIIGTLGMSAILGTLALRAQTQAIDKNK
ncbi:MAG: hypothetical protein JXB07_07335 [Anaerolineae bacterium]|nr:hypothetical protein [Anaerolineae bacterium]